MKRTLLDDLRWAFLMMRIRRYRHDLLFSYRETFDLALRLRVPHAVAAYPDTLYHTKEADFDRAVRCVELARSNP